MIYLYIYLFGWVVMTLAIDNPEPFMCAVIGLLWPVVLPARILRKLLK